MIEENAREGKFNLGYFYIRRSLRIWPLYYLTLFIGFAIYPLFFAGSSYYEPADWRMYAAFLTNFDYIYFERPKTGILGVQWSLAVEEQFYFLWPLVFLIFRGRKSFPYVMISLILLSVFLRALGFHQYHTLVAMGDLLAGALAAYIASCRPSLIKGFFARLSPSLTLLCYSIGLFIIMANFHLVKHFTWYSYIDRWLHTLFFVFVLLDQNYSPNSFFKFGSLKSLTALGKMSYGIYLLHMIGVTSMAYLCNHFGLSGGIGVVMSILIALGLSYLSYEFFEQFFLRLKDRFSVVPTWVKKL